jgi:hypothetical protein
VPPVPRKVLTADEQDFARSMKTQKTLEEHRQYLHEIVRLKIWFLWSWLRSHPEEALRYALRERVDIYRKTDLNPDGMNPKALHFDCPGWLALEEKFEVLWTVARDDAERFESDGFRIFQPSVDARCARDFYERPYVLDYKCGSLTYDDPMPDTPQRVAFHIANANAPGSVFEPASHLAECLQNVMTGAAHDFGATELQTGTWLNGHPRFLAYFPDCWRDRLSPAHEDVRWNFSWWGQLLTARGTFNAKAGEYLRETGKFPSPPRTGWCTFEELRTHLAPSSSLRVGDEHKQDACATFGYRETSPSRPTGTPPMGLRRGRVRDSL